LGGRGSQPAEGGEAKQAGQRGEQDAAVNHLMSPYGVSLSNTSGSDGSYIGLLEIISLSCERALILRMILSENRFTLFRIMR
jgi:hypothetical protein